MSDRKPRQTKTPRQRAEETVATLERTHARLMARRAHHQREVDNTTPEIADVERRLEHARNHPDLTSTTDTTED